MVNNFQKWLDQNMTDLVNLYELYEANSNFLSIDHSILISPNKQTKNKKLFKEFCSFIYQQTSNHLKNKLPIK